MGAPARVIATVAMIVLVAGCGDDDEPATPSVGATRTVVETVTQSATPAATVATEITVRQVDELTAFSSPSGNVGCYIDKQVVRCDIRERAWKPPPRPARCDLDYGQGIAIGAGEQPSFVCAGDTALGGADNELAYGEGIQSGVLRCESRRSGMRCRDTESGRGFSLSRERYDLF